MKVISRPNARVLCVLAVLIGLFGMHGLASGSAGGCHQMPGMAAASPVASVAATVTGTAPLMAGAACVFVAPSGWPPVALVLLGVVAMVALSAAGIRRGPSIGGRSPPDSVLLRVCVSRT